MPLKANMSDAQYVYLKVTPEQLQNIQLGLKTLEKRRLASRKANEKKREASGKTQDKKRLKEESVDSAMQRQSLGSYELTLVSPVDILTEYKKLLSQQQIKSLMITD